MDETAMNTTANTTDTPTGAATETPPVVPAAPLGDLKQNDKQKKVRALVRVSHDGETYEPDEFFSVGGKQLQALLDVKAVKTA